MSPTAGSAATLVAGELGYAHLHYMVQKNGEDVCAYEYSTPSAKTQFEEIAAKTGSDICVY